MELLKKPKGRVQSTFVPPSYQPKMSDKAFNNWIKYISKKAA